VAAPRHAPWRLGNIGAILRRPGAGGPGPGRALGQGGRPRGQPPEPAGAGAEGPRSGVRDGRGSGGPHEDPQLIRINRLWLQQFERQGECIGRQCPDSQFVRTCPSDSDTIAAVIVTLKANARAHRPAPRRVRRSAWLAGLLSVPGFLPPGSPRRLCAKPGVSPAQEVVRLALSVNEVSTIFDVFTDTLLDGG